MYVCLRYTTLHSTFVCLSKGEGETIISRQTVKGLDLVLRHRFQWAYQNTYKICEAVFILFLDILSGITVSRKFAPKSAAGLALK